MGSLPPLKGSYSTALKLIDDAHAQDPNKAPGADGSADVPYELHYAQKMTRWLALRCPDASPELQIACRAQHFRRFVVPTCSTWAAFIERMTDTEGGTTKDGSYHAAATP